MCGIIGYVGPRSAADVVLTGLRYLEYRGYDSAGIACITRNGSVIYDRDVRAEQEQTSAIDRIAARLSGAVQHTVGVGIGHTRWATHGRVIAANAHPHRGCTDDLYLVHNGQVTNDMELRRALTAAGHLCRSETDTELIVHCIEDERQRGRDLTTAVARALERVDGALAIAVVATAHPDRIICARRGSSLLVGLGDGECMLASDEAAIVANTKRIVDLEDGDIATVTCDGIHGVQRSVRIATWDVEEARRGGHIHFTRKEISEQADTVARAINHGGRILREAGDAHLGGLIPHVDHLRRTQHIRLIGAGTAYHAACVGRQMLLEVAGVRHVEAECASEVHGTSFHVGAKTAVIAISQSGETHDTLLALAEAKRKGALAIGVVNKVATAIARMSDCGVYCNAGPEIGVASTKAFVSQLTVLALIALFLGRRRSLPDADGVHIAAALLALPDQVRAELDHASAFAADARTLADRRAFFVIGRKWHFPVALEAALKMKELAYVHAEGYAAGELKHGPLAVLADDAVVIALAPKDETFHDVLLAIQQVRKTGATVIGITTPDGADAVGTASGYTPHVVTATLPMLQPILSILPLQLFAYELAVALGRDVDKPRHLAKSVTVK